MQKIIKCGIVNESEIIEMEDGKLIPYLYELLNKQPELEETFKIYKTTTILFKEETIIECFVKVLGYTIIYNGIVYYQEGVKTVIIDKIAYVKRGFKLKKLPKMILKKGRFVKYLNPIQQYIERIGFEHSRSYENDLSFWYPKTSNIGFRTPNTTIINFTAEEVQLIKRGRWSELNQKKILERIRNKNNTINLDEELFVRLGNSSNKFNFDSCHIKGIQELFSKLMIMLDDMYFKLEWQQNVKLVLREYINTNYIRAKIYNGMPLNTEFRVFYDFDSNTFLGIFNYWDKDTMLDNLHNEQDLITFANATNEIERQFNDLYPLLKEEVEYKLPKADLKGKWSIDFLYDGEDFVLIDMAHAECSYYYDKVLIKE